MKWLNFIPLVLWAIGFLCATEWSLHLRQIDGRVSDLKTQSEAGAKLWLYGSILFLIIGILLSI